MQNSQTATNSPSRPPMSQIIIYAIGQLGWSLAIYGVGNLLVYFYLPPESAEGGSVFPSFIYQGSILGFATVIGLITAGGRVFDAFTDPLIAGWSDRVKVKMGKRKFFLAISAFPLALFSFLVFYPLSQDAAGLNTIWLIASAVIFYFFFTMYMVPYTALISELGHHPDDRLKISTAIALTWGVGFLIASNVYGIQAYLEQSYDSVTAFQLAMAGIAFLSLIAMLVPVFFLQENRYAQQQQEQIGILNSLSQVLKFSPFRRFVVADMLYWLALTFIQIGVSYYIIVLMGLDKSFASQFMVIAFIVSLLCYGLVNFLVPRFGKKAILSLAFILLACIFGITSFSNLLPSKIIFYTLAIASGFPIAVFSIVPNAIIADMVHLYQEKSGQQLSAMFFGVRNFGMKLGMSLANLIFPSLILLGKSVENPFGVQLAAGIACGICLAGFFIFRTVKTD